MLGVKKLIWVAISLEYQLRRKDFFFLFSLKCTASLLDVVVIEMTSTCFIVTLSGTCTLIVYLQAVSVPIQFYAKCIINS